LSKKAISKKISAKGNASSKKNAKKLSKQLGKKAITTSHEAIAIERAIRGGLKIKSTLLANDPAVRAAQQRRNAEKNAAKKAERKKKADALAVFDRT
jgi:hypothetical protein